MQQGNLETIAVVLTAGVGVTIPGHGDKVFLMDAAAAIDLEFFGADGGRIGYANGLEMPNGGGPGPMFNRLRLKSAVDQTVVLAITAGSFTISKIAGVVAVKSAAALTSFADLSLLADTKALVFSSSTSAKERIIRSPKTNAVNIRVGGDDTDATAGIEIEPGQTTVITTAGAVYAFAVGGVATLQRIETNN